MTVVETRLTQIRARVAESAAKSGRAANVITIVAVTKGASVESILQARDAGLKIFAESKIQDAMLKVPQVEAQWHFIGHLQSNKVTDALGLFQMIQSVDSVRVAGKINEVAALSNQIIPVLLEVNISGQPQRFGFGPEEIYGAIDAVCAFPQIHIQGLMGIAPNDADPDVRRAAFRKLKNIFSVCKSLKKERLEMLHLSMGMSDDYELAIEEGSTMLRLGRALFQ